jgi:hypothetical protein
MFLGHGYSYLAQNKLLSYVLQAELLFYVNPTITTSEIRRDTSFLFPSREGLHNNQLNGQMIKGIRETKSRAYREHVLARQKIKRHVIPDVEPHNIVHCLFFFFWKF